MCWKGFALFCHSFLPHIFHFYLNPPTPSRQLEAEPLNGDNWGEMVGPCLTNLLTQQSTDCSWDLVTQQPPIVKILAIISRQLLKCMSDGVIRSESFDNSLPCLFSRQPCPFIPLTQLLGLFWTAAGVLRAGSMLSGGLFAVSWDETGGQLDGPMFYVHEWTLDNHLMRAGGNMSTFCLLSPLCLLSSHTFTHKGMNFFWHLLCVSWNSSNIRHQWMCVFL